MNNKVTEEFNISSTEFNMTSSEFVPTDFKASAPAFIPQDLKPVPEVQKIIESVPEPQKPVAPTPPKKTEQEIKLETKLASMGTNLLALFTRIKNEKLTESNLRDFLQAVTPTKEFIVSANMQIVERSTGTPKLLSDYNIPQRGGQKRGQQ